MVTGSHEKAQYKLHEVAYKRSNHHDEDTAYTHHQETSCIFLQIVGWQHHKTLTLQFGLHIAKDVAGRYEEKQYDNSGKESYYTTSVIITQISSCSYDTATREVIKHGNGKHDDADSQSCDTAEIAFPVGKQIPTQHHSESM